MGVCSGEIVHFKIDLKMKFTLFFQEKNEGN